MKSSVVERIAAAIWWSRSIQLMFGGVDQPVEERPKYQMGGDKGSG